MLKTVTAPKRTVCAAGVRVTPKPVLSSAVLHIPYQPVLANERVPYPRSLSVCMERERRAARLGGVVAVGLVGGGKLGAEAERPGGDALQRDNAGETLAQAQQGEEVGIVGIGDIATFQ